VVRTVFNITAAAAVTTIFARVFFGIVCVFISSSSEEDSDASMPFPHFSSSIN
jgi:hypothetical protein